MAYIMGFTRFQASCADCISNLANNLGLSILAVNGFNELFLFHTVQYQTQNLFCSESKLLGRISNAKWERSKRSHNPGSDVCIAGSWPNPTTFRGKIGMVVPPLVLVSILESNLFPAQLIPILLNKLQEFDRSSPTVKACTLLWPVLEFLWAVHKNIIPPLIFSIDWSTESQDWAKRLHFAHIDQLRQAVLPPAFPLPPPPKAQSTIGQP